MSCVSVQQELDTCLPSSWLSSSFGVRTSHITYLMMMLHRCWQWKKNNCILFRFSRCILPQATVKWKPYTFSIQFQSNNLCLFGLQRVKASFITAQPGFYHCTNVVYHCPNGHWETQSSTTQPFYGIGQLDHTLWNCLAIFNNLSIRLPTLAYNIFLHSQSNTC